MKEIILSADGDSFVYAVPDDVADNLEKYCQKFYKWLKNDPGARKYRVGGGLRYCEADFIDYLNRNIYPDEKSVMKKNLGWTNLGENIPEEYKNCPYYNF